MLNSSQKEPHKNDETTKTTSSELNKNKCNLVKGPKPLQKFKFYLDVKSHVVSNKLESKIKELGGVTEYFLVQEVTHVISDNPNQCPNPVTVSSPVTPRLVESANESPGPSPSGVTTAGRLRLKTRSDAMLEKVRSQNASKTRDPLENAKLWGIPIWTVNKIFSFLEKVNASISLKNVQKSSKSVKVINIKAPFVKFEPLLRDARPVYKPLQSWPVINLEASPGKPVFSLKTLRNPAEVKITDAKPDLAAPNESKMTRKQRTRLSVRSSLKGQEVEKQMIVGGFCEICHCDYREIGEHVRSEQHLNFVKNDANFLELDSLISAGANVEAFLRLNGSTSNKDGSPTCPLFARRSLRKINGKTSSGSPEKCNGLRTPTTYSDYSPPVTRNKMPRTRSSSQQSALSPTGSEGGHQLRSRGQLWLPTALIGTTAEDEQFANVKKEFGNRKSCGRDEETCGKPEKLKKSGLKTGNKRISADERLVADNKTYYKVEVMTTKLRSSGLGAREQEVARRVQTPIPEETQSEDQSLVVKFKRVRKSELSVLNDEAENFMFPRKEDESTDCDTDDGAETTRSSIKSESSEMKSSETEVIQITDEDSLASSVVCDRKRKRVEEQPVEEETEELGRGKRRKLIVDMDESEDEMCKEDSLDSDYVCSVRKRRKKRRTHAETFLADNQRYYKFQTPGSRLRYQGSVFAQTAPKPTKAKQNGELPPQPIVLPPVEETHIEPLPELNLKFSFEFLPKSEPWYKTFERQDAGDEFYTCFSDAGHSTRFILPYQLPYLPPVDPRQCIEDYKKKIQTYFKVETGTEVASLDSVSGTSGATGTGRKSPEKKDETVVKEPKQPIIRRKKKRRFIKLSNHPRKSPRQHASTLAILSSLIEQRKKRARKSEHATESDNSRLSLASIPEEAPTPTVKPEIILNEQESIIEAANESLLNSALEEILTAPMNEFTELELPQDGIEIRDKPDAIDLIESYDQIAKSPKRGYNRNGRARKVRKRNKNRTGWPNKKRLFPVRRQAGKQPEKDICKVEKLPEVDESNISDLSVENSDLDVCEDANERLNTSNDETELLKQGEIWTENVNKISEISETISNNVVENNNSVVDIKTDDNDLTSENDIKIEINDEIKLEPTETEDSEDLEPDNHKKDSGRHKTDTETKTSSTENTKNATETQKNELDETTVSEVDNNNPKTQTNCSKIQSKCLEIQKNTSELNNQKKSTEILKLESLESQKKSSTTQNKSEQCQNPKKELETKEHRLKTQIKSTKILNMSSETQNTSSETQSTSSETQNTNSETQYTSSETQNTSCETQDTSSESQYTSSETQNMNSEDAEIHNNAFETQNNETDSLITQKKCLKTNAEPQQKRSDLDTQKLSLETPKKGVETQRKGIETQKTNSEPQHKRSELETQKLGLETQKKGVETQKKGIEPLKQGIESQRKGLETNQKNREFKKIEAETRKIEEQKSELKTKIHRNLTLILEPLKNDLMKLENCNIEHQLSDKQLDGLIVVNRLENVGETMESGGNRLKIEDIAEKGLITPRKHLQRTSSSDCSGAEEVIPSATDRLSECVHVTLDKWENAEKVLHAKMNDNETILQHDRLFQPFVRVQKIDNSTALQVANRRLRSSSSPERKPKAKRAKIAPPSPRSPRKLRAPRGKWYRER